MLGLFDLKTAEDLCRKLEWEYEERKKDPLNPYHAWNFFVTAEHLPEWLGRTDSRFSYKKFKQEKPLLRICSHLASGGKHFRPGPEHTSVASTRQQSGWVKPGWVKPGWVKLPALMVDLTHKEKEDLKLDSSGVEALWLADRVLEFWHNYFGRNPRS
jgi:hypothetical protein